MLFFVALRFTGGRFFSIFQKLVFSVSNGSIRILNARTRDNVAADGGFFNINWGGEGNV